MSSLRVGPFALSRTLVEVYVLLSRRSSRLLPTPRRSKAGT
ncbi:MAG: hypothetical protein AB1832_04765 [Pseudomonadota bacterium]